MSVEGIAEGGEVNGLFHDSFQSVASHSLAGASALTLHCIGFYH
jgi:hypothetical protein